MSLQTCTIQCGVSSAGEINSFGGVTSSPTFSDLAAVTQLSNGTSSGQAQVVIFGTLTPSTSGTTYDLNVGNSGSNLPVGQAGTYRAFTGVKLFKIENLDSAINVTLQGGASNAWVAMGIPANGSPTTIGPGGVFYRFEPATAVTVDSTHKTFLLTAASGTPNVKISVIGLGS